MSGAETAAGPGPVTCRIDAVDVHAFEVPTDGPDGKEQDGTLEWDSATIVLVPMGTFRSPRSSSRNSRR